MGQQLQHIFMKQAKCDGDEANIEDYRYDGSKPKAKEAAIVMLADTIEAAIRSMSSKKQTMSLKKK